MIHGGDIYSEPIEYDFSVNLNPLDCSEISALILEACSGKLCNYPDSKQRGFRNAVAETEGVKNTEVYGGNGASELLMAVVAMLKPKKVMLLNPCFAGYRHVIAPLYDCDIVEYQLTRENDFMPDKTFAGVLEYEAKNGLDLLILTNPNNPNGRNIPKDTLINIFEICKKYGIKIVVDECFIKMSDNGYSMVPHINEYSGLYIVNAYTKLFSIPGVRVGYVISNGINIARLTSYLPEWNMSVIASEAGVICSRYLKEGKWEKETRATIRKEREYLSSELKKLGFEVFESDTVFLLVHSSEDIFEYLKSKGILIRDCSDFEGLEKGYYRIAVKGHSENEKLIQVLTSNNH